MLIIDKITDSGIVCLLIKAEGKLDKRRCLDPGSDITTEPPEVQTACTEAWTPEVVEAYRLHLESTV